MANLLSVLQHYMRAIKFGMSLKQWTFRVCNGMLKLAFYEIYECTKWLLDKHISILPDEIHQRLIITHLNRINKQFKFLRPRYFMCLALKYLISGNQRLAKRQLAHAIRLAKEFELDAERKYIEMTRKQIFQVIHRRQRKPTKQRRTKS